MAPRKILFFLSGSIAAFKAAGVISKLVQQGCEVQTVATASALKFIGAATLEGLTGKRVLTDLWEEGRAMDHIHLSRWADEGVLCPASANTIARIAQGLADDLTSTMICAWPKSKPLHVFPAMNKEMLSHPATQENIRRLRSFGHQVHETVAGNLACGEEGSGRLMEIEDILKVINGKPTKKGSVLITAGATRESIDGIRFISNVSTGGTGARLADLFSNEGWEVHYLCGESAKVPDAPASVERFSDFESLNGALRANLSKKEFALVIHAAAVSDYSVDRVNQGVPQANLKLSSQENLNIALKKNFKILPRLKEYSRNKEIKVIGFKLTLNESRDRRRLIAEQMLNDTIDAVVANDWSEVSQDRSRHPGEFITAGSSKPFKDLSGLAAEIMGAI